MNHHGFAESPNLAWTGNIVRIPLAMGFVVVILADGLGSFGGGNYNPAVSVALAINLRITILRGIVLVSLLSVKCLIAYTSLYTRFIFIQKSFTCFYCFSFVLHRGTDDRWLYRRLIYIWVRKLYIDILVNFS